MTIEALVAPFADSIVAFFSVVAELVVRLAVPCVKSLRYTFSSSYRKSVSDQFEGRGRLYFAAYASWGVFVVIVFVVVSILVTYKMIRPEPTVVEICKEITVREMAKCAAAVRDAVRH